MTKRERIAAALAGEPVDRVPCCFWHHFGGNETGWAPMARAHQSYDERFDFDFIKVMNDTPYVDTNAGSLATPWAFRRLGKVDLSATSMAPQIGGLRQLRDAVGDDVMMICTVFGAFATVNHLSGRRGAEAIAEDEGGVREGLKRIADNLADFAAAAVAAGADGIFLASQSSKGVLPDGQYEEMIKPFDLRILEGAEAGVFNVVHVCGRESDFGLFLDYPVHAVNWDDRAAGPSIAEAKGLTDKCLLGGIDHTTVADAPVEDVREQVRDAIRQGGGTNFILTGCCSVPNDISAERLLALRDAAREG